MARRVFFSFHYVPDSSRAAQIRNIGALDGDPPVSDNDWTTIKKGGDAAITSWIAQQMFGRSCVVVLIGADTAGRKWITHEIIEGWNAKKGIVGIHVHNLKDFSQTQSRKGGNPFAGISIGGVDMSQIVKAYDPPFIDSKSVYGHIAANLATWADEAAAIRARHS